MSQCSLEAILLVALCGCEYGEFCRVAPVSGVENELIQCFLLRPLLFCFSAFLRAFSNTNQGFEQRWRPISIHSTDMK